MSVPIFLYLWPSALGGDTDFMIVYGNSMLPTIEPGSIVITKKVPDYYIDDIVSYTQSEEGIEKVVVHRIIDEADDGFIIRGDNNRKNDPGTVPPETIHGKAIFWIPYGGYALELARNPLVMAVISVAMLAVRSGKKEKINQNNQTKPKKPDYNLFYAAIAVNLITYVLMQMSISAGITPKVDVLTKFLFEIFIPPFASTLSFAGYSFFIIGIYFMARTYKPKPSSTRKSNRGIRLLMQKESNPMLLGAQLLWILYIMLALVSTIAMVRDLGILTW